MLMNYSKHSFHLHLALLLSSFSFQLSGQAPIIQPGLPGQPGRIISAEEASDLAYGIPPEM